MTSPRTILITGATDGLGRALAQRLAADGATVLLHGRDQEKLIEPPAAAPGRCAGPHRYVASIGQHPLDLMLTRGYTGTRAYGQSKLAQIMSGFELADRIPATEVTINSLHPATYMPTKIVLAEVGSSIDTLDSGVAATYRLVSDPALDGATGQFFNKTHPARADRQAYDRTARAELWNRSLQLTGEPDIPAEPDGPR